MRERSRDERGLRDMRARDFLAALVMVAGVLAWGIVVYLVGG